MFQCLAPKGAIPRLEALNHGILITDKTSVGSISKSGSVVRK